MQLNKIFPIQFYYYLRFTKDFLFPQEISLVDTNKVRCWFLDVPDYGNLGDQAIAYAIVSFIKTEFPQIEIIEIPQSKTISCLNFVKKHIKSQDIIVLTGGGNLGNLYPRYEFIRRIIIKKFSHIPIIIFPQSVYFTNNLHGSIEKRISSRIYSKHTHLTICARDSQSFSYLKRLFNKNQVLLCPDIVLFLSNRIPCLKSQRKGVCICLREDQERILNSKDRDKLLDSLQKHFKQLTFIDTLLPGFRYSQVERHNQVLNILNKFAQYQLVVTDRLHGLIFSYITNTPCLFLPSRTGKTIALYHDWLEASSSIEIYDPAHLKLLSSPIIKDNPAVDFVSLRKICSSLLKEGSPK